LHKAYVMKRYVLALIFLFISVLIPFYSLFPEEYFGSDILKKRAEELFSRDIETYIAGLDISAPESESEQEELEPEDFPLGFKLEKDFARPNITYTDSVKIKTGRVKKMRKISIFESEPQSYIPVNEYLEDRLDENFRKRWMSNTDRSKSWKEKEKGGGLSDLDFALPVGKRFEKFVGGKTSLMINGSQRVTFSGRSEWTEGQIETSVSKNSSFPSLSMKQEPRFQIRGKIGERITVDIKQDPQQGPLANLQENISLKYQGEDNSIIKYIEAGNTSLNLEGATFAGYRGTHKGLFGIRTEGQLGPLKLTAIASQEKSEAAGAF